jgi:hypothetical protein
MKIKRIQDIEEHLVPMGTKVVYYSTRSNEKEIGIIDGNDLETMDNDDNFEDINYYIIPLEHINDQAPSNHYVMLLREDFEIIKEE